MSEKEYREILKNISLIPAHWSAFQSSSIKESHRPVYQKNTEDCSGDYLVNCSKCTQCFSCEESENCKYCDGLLGGVRNVDLMDVSHFGIGAELCLECQCVGGNPGLAYHMIFSDSCWPGADLIYCHYCVQGTQDCFGCIGLKKARYCIFNEQYTKEEYEALVPQIIEKMKADGEWGEFFPISMSPFGYNETIAQEYFPLTKEEALARGWKWHEEEAKTDQYLGPKYEIPDDIKNVSDDITKAILLCEVTGKPYKIIPQELKFYRQMGIPIPRKCPDQRHKERMALRNPRKLWKRNCQKCQKAIETTYAPERKEIVYCEECYLKEVY